MIWKSNNNSYHDGTRVFFRCFFKKDPHLNAFEFDSGPKAPGKKLTKRKYSNNKKSKVTTMIDLFRELNYGNSEVISNILAQTNAESF